MVLANIQEACQGIENEYEHRAILYIGSESYDAPVITFLRGAFMLGFKIYTIGKPNVNSWNINTVIPASRPLPRFDFVLSNLHWGTRWRYYDRFGLHTAPKVLMAGDDNPWSTSWRDLYEIYWQRYADVEERVKDLPFMPRRWIEPLGRYEPDIVFAGQNQPKQSTHYLPFGIMPEYTEMALQSGSRRNLLFRHIPGAGPRRKDAHKRLTEHKWRGAPSVRILESGHVRGDKTWPAWVPQPGRQERNVHSWHRWSMDRAYYKALSATHVLIYPGISPHHWESKRPWEAFACGCAVLMKRPPLDTSDYPLDELAPGLLTYRRPQDLTEHCEMLLLSEGEDGIDELRRHVMDVAYAYFRPKPIARYALHRILEAR